MYDRIIDTQMHTNQIDRLHNCHDEGSFFFLFLFAGKAQCHCQSQGTVIDIGKRLHGKINYAQS